VRGINIIKTTKYKNILKNNKVAIVIDDLKTVDPLDPRGIKIYGVTDAVTRQGGHMDRLDENTAHRCTILEDRYIRIRPSKKWS
jgi:pyridoxamine 5'-phosphate oxidase family protein